MTRSHVDLRIEQESACAAIRQGECVFRDLSHRACTEYSSLVCAHSTSYCSHVSAILADAQMQAEHFGWFCLMVSKNGQLLHVGETNSDADRGGEPHSPVLVAMKLVLSLPRSDHFNLFRVVFASVR